jgi:DNA polymerase
MTPDETAAARELLAFYLEAGVDVALGDAPIDRFAEPAAVAVATSPRLRGEVDRARAQSGEGLSPRPGLSERASHPDPLPAHHRPSGFGGASSWGGEAPSAKTPSGEREDLRRRRTINRAAETGARPVPPAPVAPEVAVMAAREAAKSATTMQELRAIVAGFEGCALKSTARQLVFADGNPAARVMFVGEAPGRDEDIEGLPFVGPSGQLLDRIMAAIGLDRTSAYIANIIPWRPPGNRTPTPQEAAICLPFILRQIELCDPQVLVCLGGPSAQALLNVKEGILKIRGRWFTYHTGSREIRAIATLHPAYLLRQPLQKRLTWRDFLTIRKALDSGISGQ